MAPSSGSRGAGAQTPQPDPTSEPTDQGARLVPASKKGRFLPVRVKPPGSDPVMTGFCGALVNLRRRNHTQECLTFVRALCPDLFPATSLHICCRFVSHFARAFFRVTDTCRTCFSITSLKFPPHLLSQTQTRTLSLSFSLSLSRSLFQSLSLTHTHTLSHTTHTPTHTHTYTHSHTHAPRIMRTHSTLAPCCRFWMASVSRCRTAARWRWWARRAAASRRCCTCCCDCMTLGRAA